MAAPRFLANISGRIRMLATIVASAGAADAEKVPSTNANGYLDPSLINAATTGAGKVLQLLPDGTIDPSAMPTGIGADVKILPASEALAANDLVNVWSDAGVAKLRKADATAEGKEAHGFVKASFALNAQASMYLEGRISGLTGLTPGARMYLSAATPGAAAALSPSAAGNVSQHIGDAVSTTEIDFEKAEPITVA
ncbi:hypothetical protein XccvBFoX4_gp43 [Xanthomonas phage FoX4]|uniref:Uncharacterized protein n=1 Tax=Xanthomonas phage FoX4 TaxID=2723900 RepID=A0A858WLZ3_9CAUD|nr:hypothetical protein KNU97_gp43 [Xanthomonas phage FoX4]QJI52997.1 hypothetical protein XccvBFoX4_gp43 [Xanthomonas phage FoX4]